jgi:tRNA(Arg) A34 adenosine deaminase TadA
VAPRIVAPDLNSAIETGTIYYESAEPCPKCSSTIKHLANKKCYRCSPPRTCPVYGRRRAAPRKRWATRG